ncbi:MAG TPA: tetratricopeptide repeat protein [Spirochaetota bacterium]|nr:tetratricopeptide repeat protein [Spirochaetota bacterium]
MKRIALIMLIILLGGFISAQQSSSMLYDQALEAIRAKNYKSAELILQSIIKNDDGYKERATFNLAKSIHYQKRYKSAVFEFNRYLSISTDDNLKTEARYWIARSHYLDRNYHHAIEEFKRFISENPNDNYLITDSYRQIGYIYFRQRRYDEALIEWRNALQVAEDDALADKIRYDIALAYFNTISYNESEKILKTLLSSSKQVDVKTRANILFGRIEQRRGHHKQALVYFGRVTKELLPRRPYYNVLYYMGTSFIELKDDRRAIAALKKYLSYSSGNDSSLNDKASLDLGRILSRANREDEALEILLELIEKSENQILKVEAINIAGRIYLKRNDLYKARPLAEKILLYEIDYDSRNAYLLLSDIYVQLAMFSRAEKILLSLQKELAFDPELDMIQYKLSLVYLREKKYDKAIEGFKRIDDFNPFSSYKNEYHYFMAVSSYDKKNYSETIKYCTIYLKKPEILNAYDARILRLDSNMRLKRFDSARLDANFLITNFPKGAKNSGVIYDYALFLESNKRDNTKYINYVVTSFPKSDITFIILRIQGEKHFNNAEYKKAEEVYARLFSAKEKNADIEIVSRYLDILYKNRNYKLIDQITGNAENADERVRPIMVLYAARSAFKRNHFQTSSSLYNGLYISDSIKMLADQDYYYMAKNEIYLDNLEAAKSFTKKIGESNYREKATRLISDFLIRKNGVEDAAVFAEDVFKVTEKPGLKSEIALIAAENYLLSGNSDKSFKILSTLKKHNHKTVNLMVNILIGKGDYNHLFEFLNKTRDVFSLPDDKSFLLLLGKLSDITLNYKQDSLFLFYNNILMSNKDYRGKAESNFAYFYYINDNANKAFSYSMSALNKNPTDPRSLFIAAEIDYYHYKNYRRSKQLFDRLLLLPYDRGMFVAKGRISYALILFSQKKYSDAIAHLKHLADHYRGGALARASAIIKSHYGYKNETD